jgi:hypothetical protein
LGSDQLVFRTALLNGTHFHWLQGGLGVALTLP